MSTTPALARKHRKPAAAKAARPEDDPRKHGEDQAFAAARVSFAEPRDLAELPENEAVPVALVVAGYALGPAAPGGPSPHAHLIIDNEPARTVSSDGPLTLSGLARGPHLLRAVLCRPWHEVVKAPGSFALVRFWIGPKLEGKSGKAAEYVAWPDAKKPLLTYVLPIGAPGKDAPDLVLERADGSASDEGTGGASDELAAAAERPILDFYLSQARLARRGDKVRVVLDRRELPLVTEWKPQRLRRARPGPHKLTIDLLNRRGLKVKNAVNRSDRSFVARE